MVNPNTTPIGENKKSRKGLKLAGTLTLVAASSLAGVAGAGASTKANYKTTSPPKELVRDIAILDNGGQVDVAAVEMKIPVPIGDAGGQPIIYEDGKGGNYYAAYTQGYEPDFKLTPTETASTMAIVNLGPDYQGPLVGAHLNKLGELVTTDNIQTVGYSMGGDKGK